MFDLLVLWVRDDVLNDILAIGMFCVLVIAVWAIVETLKGK